MKSAISPGERYASTYEIDFLRCIFCGYCEDACPTEAIVLEHEYELSFTNRRDAIYPKEKLLVTVPPGGLPTPQRVPPGQYDRAIPVMQDQSSEHWLAPESGAPPAAPASGRPAQIDMTPDLILFLALAILAVVSAVAMLLARQATHAALFLVFNFSTVAVIFLTLNAPFIALAQVRSMRAPSWSCSSSSSCCWGCSWGHR